MTKFKAILTKLRKANKPKQNHAWHWSWIPSLFIKPRSTVRKVAAANEPVWLTPLLILTVLVLISVMIAAPIRRLNIQTGANLPEGFQYWSQEMQQQYLQAQTNLISPTFMYLFPAMSGVAAYWFIWFLLSSLLHLTHTLAGSRAGRVKASNLVAWAMLPFAIRVILQIIGMLASKQLPVQTGLANLIAADAEGVLAYARGILSNIDAYWLFHVVLLYLGARPLSGLSRSKAFTSTTIAILTVLMLQGLPSLISSLFKGLSGGSGMYFF